jgi:hypothetical protein
VIALSRFRARLARGQRARRAGEIFASNEPRAVVRAMPGDELFYTIQEIGFPDAMEVLQHASGEQVQSILDFSVWNRDRIDIEKANEWLAVLVEAPTKTVGEWAQDLDIELLALLIRQRARIFDLSLEEAPEEPEGTLWNTPDRLFSVELLGDQDQARVTQRLLDHLYRYSPTMMRRWLVGMRAETDAELEEVAQRWRAGRMADLGFVDSFEALDVYQELDPSTVQLGRGADPDPVDPGASEPYLRLPAVMADRLTGKTPFTRGAAGLTDPNQVVDLHTSLVMLCNRVLSADRVAPSDEELIQSTLERVSSTLDLAVELLARGDAEREIEVVRSVPALRLHRLGHSLIAKLQRLANALVRGNPFAPLRPKLDIFEHEDAEILASLVKSRPRMPRLLDNPPAAGERPFAALADLALATQAVERAAAAISLLGGLGVRPEHLEPERMTSAGLDPAAIDAAVVARTVLVARLLGVPQDGVQPLDRAATDKFKQNFNNSQENIDKMANSAFEVLAASSPSGTASRALDGAQREVALRWIGSMSPLASVLGVDKP